MTARLRNAPNFWGGGELHSIKEKRPKERGSSGPFHDRRTPSREEVVQGQPEAVFYVEGGGGGSREGKKTSSNLWKKNDLPFYRQGRTDDPRKGNKVIPAPVDQSSAQPTLIKLHFKEAEKLKKT